MTYIEALKEGYKIIDRKLFRGYVSRKIDTDKQPLKEAKGFRKGQFYVELPCYSSSRYSYRVYLVK